MFYISSLEHFKDNLVDITDTKDGVTEQIPLQVALDSKLTVRGREKGQLFQGNSIKKDKDISYIGDKIYPPVFDFIIYIGYVRFQGMGIDQEESFPVAIVEYLDENYVLRVAGGIATDKGNGNVEFNVSYASPSFYRKVGVAQGTSTVLLKRAIIKPYSEELWGTVVDIVPEFYSPDGKVLKYLDISRNTQHRHYGEMLKPKEIELRDGSTVKVVSDGFTTISDARAERMKDHLESEIYKEVPYSLYDLCTLAFVTNPVFYSMLPSNSFKTPILLNFRFTTSLSTLPVMSEIELNLKGITKNTKGLFGYSNDRIEECPNYQALLNTYPREVNEIKGLLNTLVQGKMCVVYTLGGVYLFREKIFDLFRLSDNKELKTMQARTKLVVSDYAITEISNTKVCTIEVKTNKVSVLDFTQFKGKAKQLNLKYVTSRYEDVAKGMPMRIIIPEGVKLVLDYNSFKYVPIILQTDSKNPKMAEYLVSTMNKKGYTSIVGVSGLDPNDSAFGDVLIKNFLKDSIADVSKRLYLNASDIAFGILYTLSFYNIAWSQSSEVKEIMRELFWNALKTKKLMVSDLENKESYHVGLFNYTCRYYYGKSDNGWKSFVDANVLKRALTKSMKDNFINLSQIAQDNIQNLLNMLKCMTEPFEYLEQYLSTTPNAFSSRKVYLVSPYRLAVAQGTLKDVYAGGFASAKGIKEFDADIDTATL